MKKVIRFINNLISCSRCFGMGTLEQTSGDTVKCSTCDGRGML